MCLQVNFLFHFWYVRVGLCGHRPLDPSARLDEWWWCNQSKFNWTEWMFTPKTLQALNWLVFRPDISRSLNLYSFLQLPQAGWPASHLFERPRELFKDPSIFGRGRFVQTFSSLNFWRIPSDFICSDLIGLGQYHFFANPPWGCCTRRILGPNWRFYCPRTRSGLGGFAKTGSSMQCTAIWPSVDMSCILHYSELNHFPHQTAALQFG